MADAFRLDGRRGVVTGASSGLGRAVAVTLAKLGASLVIGARQEPHLHQTADEAADTGAVRPLVQTIDLTDEGSIRDFIGTAAARLGGIDIVINNTGGPTPGKFNDLDDRHWHEACDLVLMSSVRLLRETYPYLCRSAHAAIVNIISTSVRQPLPNLVLSNSLRMAVAGLAKSLADEWGPLGIRVNSVLPASVRTTRVEELARLSAERAGTPVDVELEARAQSAPLRRLGQPDELASAVAFLASDAAAYITGITLPVDGGSTRQSN